ncbi:uncharacterized protein LOC143554603 [Bidens hawaiensis]|uniref:uncharacterized protein LOC143554603 n=1 Tax=Bidens hawaiensis TaxID=980011 RepID=UPI0040499661
MSSSRRSGVYRSGRGGNTAQSNPNVDPQHQQLTRQPVLHANNNPNNYPINQYHQTNVPNRNEIADRNAALPMPQLVAPGPSAPPPIVTRLDMFLKSVTPIVPARKPPQSGLPFYFLGDLWEAFQEWSAYGAGVHYMLNDGKEITQYYVPYLSGIQLYIDPRNPPVLNEDQAEVKAVQSHEPDPQTSLAGSLASLNLGNQKLKQVASTSDNTTEVHGPCGMLAHEYMEKERPHLREPLSLKALLLESRIPNLHNYRSCDLLPSSWIAVAWYSFLFRGGKMGWSGGLGFSEPMVENDKVKVRLLAIGMVPYKLRGSRIAPVGNYEIGQEAVLFRSACNWLNSMN